MEFEEMIKNPAFVALIAVAILIIVVGIVACVGEIVLAVKYVKFNRKKNSLGKTGQQIAREILDKNGLEKIKVKCVGSLLFGNSYGHYFKSVRLRRRTWKKDSISSLAMAAQKSSLAVLDKEKDPAMKTRIVLTPIICFGPIAFIPLVIVGVILDILLMVSLNLELPLFTIILSALGFAFYIASFVMSIVILKSEKRAQERSYDLMREMNVSESDINDCKELFHLYNIQYVLDLIMEILELIYRILQVLVLKSNSSSSSSNN